MAALGLSWLVIEQGVGRLGPPCSPGATPRRRPKCRFHCLEDYGFKYADASSAPTFASGPRRPPLAGVVGALLGDGFPRTVYEHNCSGFLQDRDRSSKLIPIAPVVSENVLLCGMREVNASWSRQGDRKHWVSSHILSGGGGRR